MNNVHDMGGQQNFGPVDTDPEAPLFHSEWERQVLVLTLAMGATGTWNLDESRFARESLSPSYYLSAGYYRIWLSALENLLKTHGLVTEKEIREGVVSSPPADVKRVLSAEQVPAVLSAGAPVNRPATTAALFNVGDKVIVKNRHTPTHTRLPAYIRGRTGKVARVHGCHIYPDSHAIGEGENPQWLYNIEFDSQVLWGNTDARFSHVHVDCWEPYLESI